MQTIIYQIVPNEWVTEKLLIAATGLKPGTILRARKESWLLGREYKHVAPSGHPKPTSECMYYIPEINRWIKNQPDPNFDL
ncbi:excisionase family protein [Salmonella enterica]|nr:excisionase family protein [Salmonella enterica]EKA6235950.1 excisionase family protein [Salmonella enterica]ELS1445322.1 excisionase family protein [Salmonella enterica]